ncbi:hypothetical protein FQ775_10380 [Nitratireductor mangrovi]|uniref:Mll5186 protein n=1 Tax=Nitratireductor mangrovi TaxID=2599600 RepID=A0A5B8KYU6_9HYPH|nr:hypothetical protein [Nitratireductor mangrovi]QDZ00759.1 hypothetical protein FQ775_10380 [Nitratireductor mangrovi]
MAMTENTEALVVAETGSNEHTSYVDWPAIIAGAILASAISLVLLAFGSALGLSLTSPFENEGLSAIGLAIAFGLWLVWVQVSSFMAGGYVTGRLRRRLFDATEHESDVRDGMHGLAVWGTGVVIGGLMLTFGATGVLGIAAGTAGNAAGNAAAAAITELSDEDRIGYAVGSAFRASAPGETDPTDARADATSIIANGIANGEIPTSDRDYLATLIAQQTGLPEEEAQARADTLVSSAQAIAEEARIVAERARKFSIVAAFVAAASLAISAVGAWWAAGWGGRHRDEGTVVPVWFDRLR